MTDDTMFTTPGFVASTCTCECHTGNAFHVAQCVCGRDDVPVVLKITCVMHESAACWGTKAYSLDAAKYARWKGKEHIQDVFPEFSADDREFLISKCCGPCFDQLFGGEETMSPQ